MQDLTTTHQQIVRGDSTLHYWLAGPTDRPLVVFSHGGLMDHRMFEAQLPAIANEYRVLLWDMHGHGLSQPLGMGGVLSLHTIVDDLLSIVDQLGYQKACFVGQSVGAFIPQEMAFLYPQRVNAIVVIGGYCITGGMPQFFRQRRQQSGASNMSFSTLKQRIPDMAGIRPETRAYALEACAPQATWQATMQSIPGFFHEEANYRIPVPFLLTHGDQDTLTDIVQQASTWAQREPHCHYVVIPDAGHNANQDNPEFFNRVLLSFLHQHNV
jgi:3-oxoadipate enol-lactonase